MMLNEFQLNLLLLDAALTGRPWHDVYQVALQRLWTVEDFLTHFDRLYYLSDGGYSRVGWDAETNKLFLASESLDQPKEAWEGTMPIRRAIQKDIAEYWIAQGEEVDWEL